MNSKDKVYNTGVKIGRLKLKTPIVCASGTFGFGDELKDLADYSKIGAVVTKTITWKERAGNPPPRIYETRYGVINSVGLENMGTQRFLKEIVPRIKALPTSFIVSIGGTSIDEYKMITEKLNTSRALKAIEVNLSCPNIRLKKLISQSPAGTLRVMQTLRRITDKTLIAKITPETADLTGVAKAVEDSGADAVSLVNTFFSMAIDIETRKPYLGSVYGGYSGGAIKPLSLYRVWRVAQEVKIPVIGGGGIECADDALEFILAGASAVSLGTLNLAYPDSAKSVLKGVVGYMKRKDIKDINILKGTLRLPKIVKNI